MGFGERVVQALDTKKMTREELYAATGLKSSYLVGYLKNPDRSPTLSTACKIALALDVSLDYLGGLIDEPRPIRRDENGRIVAPKLTDEEREILDAYKAVDAPARRRIARAAQGELDDMEDEAKKETRGA